MIVFGSCEVSQFPKEGYGHNWREQLLPFCKIIESLLHCFGYYYPDRRSKNVTYGYIKETSKEY